MPPPDTEHQASPTLSAVADLAGVSAITVSRVVRLPEKVAPETRARVEAAMRELGYVPNLLAGALAGARTKSIGVLVPTIANSIFADTVQGLSDELEPLGYAVILAQSRYDDAREDHMLAALLSRRVLVTGILTYTLSAQLAISTACRSMDSKSSASTSKQTGLSRMLASTSRPKAR